MSVAGMGAAEPGAAVSVRPERPGESISGYATHAAIAAAIRSMRSSETVPMCDLKRITDTERSWNVSAAEDLARLLSGSGFKRTTHGYRLNLGFQAVSGTTSLRSRRPIAPLETTMQGRVFPISSPTVGSRLICQIWPRSGLI